MRRWVGLFAVAATLGAAQGLAWGIWLGAAGWLPALICGVLLGAAVVALWPPRYGGTK